MKICTKCGKSKDLSCFSRHKGFPDNRSYWCKSCVSINNKKLYEKKKDKIMEYVSLWVKSNPDKKRMYASRWNKKHPEVVQSHTRNRRARLLQVEGKITKSEWEDLVNKYNHTCLRCKRTDVKLTLDHVVPVSKGGTNTIDNAQPLCGSCNSSKHTDIIDYRLEFSL